MFGQETSAAHGKQLMDPMSACPNSRRCAKLCAHCAPDQKKLQPSVSSPFIPLLHCPDRSHTTARVEGTRGHSSLFFFTGREVVQKLIGTLARAQKWTWPLKTNPGAHSAHQPGRPRARGCECPSRQGECPTIHCQHRHPDHQVQWAQWESRVHLALTGLDSKQVWGNAAASASEPGQQPARMD